MATSMSLDGGRRVMTTPEEADQARDAADALVGPAGRLVIEQASQDPIGLPPELGMVLQLVIEVIAAGGTVTVGSMPSELTTSAAAAVLGVSRPTVMKMVSEGLMPSHRVGTHTRLRSNDVLQARRARRARQRLALDALRDLEDED